MNKTKIVSIITTAATVAMTAGYALMPLAAGAATGDWLFNWGGPGSGNGQFGPTYFGGLDADASGNVYAWDVSNFRIQKFDKDGTWLANLSLCPFTPGCASMGVGAEYQLAVDSTRSYLYIMAGIGFGNQLVRMDLNGNYLATVTTTPLRGGITVDETDGSVWGYNTGDNTFRKYDLAGNEVVNVPRTGFCAASEWQVPKDMDVDSSGNLWFVDGTCEKVTKMDGAGNVVAKYDIIGAPDGEDILLATGFARDHGNGTMYIFDRPLLQPRLTAVNAAGAFVADFNAPAHFGVVMSELVYVPSPVNRLYAWDTGERKIEVFEGVPSATPTPTPPPGECGNRVARFSVISSVAGVAADSAGNSFVGSVGGGYAGYDSAGSELWPPNFVGPGSAFDVAVDEANGIFYVLQSNASSPSVKKFSMATGSFINSFSVAEFPRGLAIDKDGDIWVISNTQGVKAYTPSGSLVAGKGFAYNGRGIAVDDDLNVYTSREGSDFVQKWSQTGTLLYTYPVYASDLAIDSFGDLLLVTYDNAGNGLFKKYDKDTFGELESWNDADWVGQIWGIDFQSDKVYVAEYSPGNKVDVYDCPARAVPTPTPVPGDYKDILTFSLQTLGQGPSSLDPISGAQLRVFDVDNSTFLSTYGAGFNQWKLALNQIYEGAIGQISQCTTDSDGACTANKAMAGNYLVVGRYADTAENMTVYVSKNELAADFNADKENFADLKIIKKYKDGAFDSYGPGGQVKVVPGLPLASKGGSSLALVLLLVAGGLGVALAAKRFGGLKF